MRRIILWGTAILLGVIAGLGIYASDYGRMLPWNLYSEDQKTTFKLEALKYLEEHGRFSAPTIYQTWDQMTDSGHTVCSALSTQPVGSVRKELLDASRTEEYPLPEAEAELIVDMTITAATAPGSLCPR